MLKQNETIQLIFLSVSLRKMETIAHGFDLPSSLTYEMIAHVFLLVVTEL